MPTQTPKWKIIIFKMVLIFKFIYMEYYRQDYCNFYYDFLICQNPLTHLLMNCYYFKKCFKYLNFSKKGCENLKATWQAILSSAAWIALTTQSAHAAEAPKPSTPTAAAREVILLSVALQGKLFISLMLPDGSCKSYLSQNPEGFRQVLPIQNKGDDYAPAASPDGKKLAFYSTRSGAANLWLAQADGRNQRMLTNSEVSIQPFNPLLEAPIQFSPDSKFLVYLNEGNLWIFNLETEIHQSLTFSRGVEAFAFSPNGKYIAYYQRGSIRRVAISGQPDEVLVANDADWPTLAYHPDPKKNELFYFFKGVWRVDTQTRQRQLIASSYTYPNRIRLAPRTADSIAYLSLSPEMQPEIHLASPAKKTAAGRSETSLVTQGGASQPFYSQDGKTLFFLRQEGLWSISTSGEDARPLQPLPCYLAGSFNLEMSLPPECARP